MSFQAACPELDDLIQLYHALSDPNHSIPLDSVETKLAHCLAKERLDQGDAYPATSSATLKVRKVSVIEHVDGSFSAGDDLSDSNVFEQHVGYCYNDMDADNASDVVNEERPGDVYTHPGKYYVYVKRDPCMYLSKTRDMLSNTPYEERPFDDTDAGKHAPEPHATTLRFESSKGPLSSPQIFHGAEFIPGGSAGLAKHLDKQDREIQNPTVPLAVIDPAISATTVAAPKRGTHTWFVYGSLQCKYCKLAMRILGGRAIFVEMYTYNPVQAKPFPHIHPAHRAIVGPDRAVEIHDEILRLRSSDGVPIIYHEGEHVANDFSKLEQRLVVLDRAK